MVKTGSLYICCLPTVEYSVLTIISILLDLWLVSTILLSCKLFQFFFNITIQRKYNFLGMSEKSIHNVREKILHIFPKGTGTKKITHTAFWKSPRDALKLPIAEKIATEDYFCPLSGKTLGSSTESNSFTLAVVASVVLALGWSEQRNCRYFFASDLAPWKE